MHRTYHARGNLPDILANTFGAKFVNIDYPKNTYDVESMNKQVIEYLEKNPNAKEIIICGLSFGELTARDVLANLPADLKEKVVGHISLNGVSDTQDLAVFQNRFTKAFLPLIKTDLFDTLIGIGGKIDRSKPLKRVISKNIINPRSAIREKSDPTSDYAQNVKHHRDAALLGITPGMGGRIKRIYAEKQAPKGTSDIPTVAIYSDSDGFYVNPQAAAEKVKNTSTHPKSHTHALDNADHAALVELPEKYDADLQKIIEDLGRTAQEDIHLYSTTEFPDGEENREEN